MPGAIDVDLREVDDAITGMRLASANLWPVWLKIKQPLRGDQNAHVDSQKASSGGSWPPLAPSTRDKRLSKGGRAGKFTKKGRLRKPAQRKLGKLLSKRMTATAKIQIGPKTIQIISRAKWAGVHQFGGVAGHGARIPKREFMYISDPLLQHAISVIRLHLFAGWEGRRL